MAFHMARIVLLHGFTQTGAVWRSHAAGLAALGHEVHCPDLPGHGSAPLAYDTLSLAGTATWLIETFGRAIYVGYSMGGRIGLYAALASKKVEHLVAVGTRVGIEGKVALQKRQAHEHALAEHAERDYPAFIDAWLANPVNERLTEEQRHRDIRMQNRSEGIAATLRFRGTGPALWPLRRMHATFVYGQYDIPGIAEDAQRAAELTTGKAIMVQRCGHSLPFEQPETFLEIVLQAIAETARRRRT